MSFFVNVMDKKNDRLIHLIKKAQSEYADDYLVIAVPGFLAKKFIGYCSMKEDLELLLLYIEILRTEDNRIKKSALTYALVALYGKCFTDASRNSYPKLEPKEFQHSINHLETHDF